MNENASPVANPSHPEHLHSLAALAYLLERLERGPLQASAEQYRLVAQKLREELAGAPSDAYLDAVLRTYSAAADIYENLQYGLAGLCRAKLDVSARTELEAKKVLLDAARPDA